MPFDGFGDESVDDQGPDELSLLGLPTAAKDYLIAAADKNGHSQRMYCRVPPAVGRLVTQVFQSHRYPFRTIGDLVRWCIFNNVKRLAAGPGIDSVYRQADIMIAQLAEEEMQIQFLEFFQKTEEIVNRYIVDGYPDEARRVVATMKAQIDQMPDQEAFWKLRYQKELLRRWRPMLDAEGRSGVWDLDPAELAALEAEAAEQAKGVSA